MRLVEIRRKRDVCCCRISKLPEPVVLTSVVAKARDLRPCVSVCSPFILAACRLPCLLLLSWQRQQGGWAFPRSLSWCKTLLLLMVPLQEEEGELSPHWQRPTAHAGSDEEASGPEAVTTTRCGFRA